MSRSVVSPYISGWSSSKRNAVIRMCNGKGGENEILILHEFLKYKLFRILSFLLLSHNIVIIVFVLLSLPLHRAALGIVLGVMCWICCWKGLWLHAVRVCWMDEMSVDELSRASYQILICQGHQFGAERILELSITRLSCQMVIGTASVSCDKACSSLLIQIIATTWGGEKISLTWKMQNLRGNY